MTICKAAHPPSPKPSTKGYSYCINPKRPMTKQQQATQKISAALMLEVAKGKTIREAFDAILGEGTYETLAADVWETLQAA